MTDYESYISCLAAIGITDKEARSIAEQTYDQIPFEKEYNVYVADSPIEGKGLFAKASFKAGEEVCSARIGKKRTPGGRYSNHARLPNMVLYFIGNNYYFYATRDIFEGEELTSNYYLNYLRSR
jgi:SET domain-containing protein